MVASPGTLTTATACHESKLQTCLMSRVDGRLTARVRGGGQAEIVCRRFPSSDSCVQNRPPKMTRVFLQLMLPYGISE